MNKIKVSTEKVEKLLHLIQKYSDNNYGGFDDDVNGLFPGLLPGYEKETEPFEIEWDA